MSFKAKVEKMPGYNALVRPVHWAQAVMASVKNGFPAKRLRVIAVTGTNGKTTTCFMIWKMLNEAGHRTGVLSTVGWATGADDLHQQVEHMTTERVGVLNERMKMVADAGAEFLVLETTSHALSQSRILGVPVEIAVFTNLTPEHLDYHKTFEKYRKAKLKLFKRAKIGVVNADDPSADAFSSAIASLKSPVRGSSTGSTASLRASTSPSTSSKTTSSANDNSRHEVITYGIEKGEMRATGVELLPTGVEYACGDMKIRTQIPGKFNIYNSLAAVCVGKKLGLTKEAIERGIHALESVEGRMTRVREGQEFEVIVDYAHQPDALEKVFSSISKAGRIISVHGGAGRRDPSTREPRGEILGKYSDIVIITEDDSRDEDPAEIAAMFVKGAEKAGKVQGKDLFIELDRRKAIEKAIQEARKGDIVLLLGKGHEKTILRADGAHEFEDIEVAKEVLKALGK